MFLKSINLKDLQIKYAVFFNQSSLIKFVDEYGIEDLEKDYLFVVLFDTNEDIGLMENYNTITDLYPNSDRVFDRALYIGNFRKEDWNSVINQTLDSWSHPYKYTIEHMEELKRELLSETRTLP